MNGGAKPPPGDKGWRVKPTDTWGTTDEETNRRNAELRTLLSDDPESLSAKDRARAEVLAARSQRKRDKKDRIQKDVKRQREEKELKKSGKGKAEATQSSQPEAPAAKERMRSPEAMARRAAKRAKLAAAATTEA